MNYNDIPLSTITDHISAQWDQRVVCHAQRIVMPEYVNEPDFRRHLALRCTPHMN
jgi:hypothetical protein